MPGVSAVPAALGHRAVPVRCSSSGQQQGGRASTQQSHQQLILPPEKRVILPGSYEAGAGLSRRSLLGASGAAVGAAMAAGTVLPEPAVAARAAKVAAQTMVETQTNLGSAPFTVSRMGIGTWSWGNQALWGYDPAMDAELEKTFDLCVSQGVNLFDTADSYGTGKLNGRSEENLGRFMEKYGDFKEDIHVATKFAAYPWRITTGQIEKACKESTERLGKKIDVGQLHWSVSKYAPVQELALWDGLATIYENGLVKAVGASNYGPKQLEKLIKYLAKRGVPLASVQVQWSLLSLDPTQSGIKELCDEYGVTLIAYSPLGLGMLTGKYDENNVPEGGRGVLFKQILPKIKPLLRTMKAVGKERNKTLPQIAINWCICKGTIPIPGAKTRAMAEENLGALGWRLTDGEVNALETAARNPKGGGQMIQNIFQTK